MKPAIAVVATHAFTHHGQPVAKGEYFTTTPIEAAALVYQKKALFASIERAQRARDDAESRKPAEPETPRRRRTYRRRDLTAENPEQA